MKRIVLPIAVLLALLALLSAAAASGGYDLTWHVIAGGGSNFNVSGGVYSLGATIGQPAADLSNGTGYSLSSGFWSQPALTTTATATPTATVQPGHDQLHLPLVVR